MLLVIQVHANALGPTPQIIAEYDRSFIERSGAQTFGEMLDTGIIRYFFTGGRDLLVMVNGRPYATTAAYLDTIPLSAVERIEVLRAESLGTIAGHAAVRGAVNLVLRKDLDGFDVRTVARSPSRSGGDARQGSAAWGGKIGADGHMFIGIDILDREEIVGSTREHSRSEWEPRGSFADTKNVSVGGNTVYIFDNEAMRLRSVPLGECKTELGYTGPLSNPPGIRSGDKGCGFAYGNVWWDSESYQQENVILNLNHSLAEDTELHVDANVALGSEKFRYAPAVDVFSITPSSKLLEEINRAANNANPTFTADRNDRFIIGHRFIGHGNRDWRTSSKEYDVSASLKGRLTESVDYDARISAFRYDGLLTGNTFVDDKIISEKIMDGSYNLANPLSQTTDHLNAIKESSLSREDVLDFKSLGSRFALEGAGPGIGGRNMAWTTGVEFADLEIDRQVTFRLNNGRTRELFGVLGSGGTSYAGKRATMGAFAEVSLPLVNSVNVRAAVRADDSNDVGGMYAWRLGAEYRTNDTLTLRGSWSTGDSAPSIYHLHSTGSQSFPFVRCIPESGPLPRTCASANYVQVERRISGNPELKPSGSGRRSIGFEIRRGPMYFVADWYQLTTSDLPGVHNANWSILNHRECKGDYTDSCIDLTDAEVTIHEQFANIIKTEILGLNTRFGNRVETDWGFIAMRGFWRYVTNSEQITAGVKERFPLPRSAVRIVTSAGRGNLTAFWALNYRDKIENQVGGGHFNSWIGHDLTLDWKKPFGFENSRLTAGVYNVTDAKLSLNTTSPALTDGPTAAGWGRTLFLTLNMRF